MCVISHGNAFSKPDLGRPRLWLSVMRKVWAGRGFVSMVLVGSTATSVACRTLHHTDAVADSPLHCTQLAQVPPVALVDLGTFCRPVAITSSPLAALYYQPHGGVRHMDLSSFILRQSLCSCACLPRELHGRSVMSRQNAT